jgi:hypothetical protein
VNAAAVNAAAVNAAAVDAAAVDASGQLMEHARALFERVDRNGDGQVNKRELIIVLRSEAEEPGMLCQMLGLPTGSIRQEDGSRAAFEGLFQQADANDDRQLSWVEFAALVRRQHALHTATGSTSWPAALTPISTAQSAASGRAITEQVYALRLRSEERRTSVREVLAAASAAHQDQYAAHVHALRAKAGTVMQALRASSQQALQEELRHQQVAALQSHIGTTNQLQSRTRQ